MHGFHHWPLTQRYAARTVRETAPYQRPVSPRGWRAMYDRYAVSAERWLATAHQVVSETG